MATASDLPPDPSSLSRRAAGAITRHGRALAEIAIVSGFGILASAGFQVVVTRGLGPEEFGLLAAFLALINITAIGSAALRNSVAVDVAEYALIAPALARRRVDSSLTEAAVLGTGFAVFLLLAAPWLANSLQSNSVALLLTAATIIPYFVFARSLGLLQGSEQTRSVVWWSTGAQFVQLALAVGVILLGWGAIGILGIFLATVVLATIGSAYQTRSIRGNPATRAFSPNTIVVVMLTIMFAWLTNVDVILVRAEATELAAGSYAAAAVLVKTILILPATLSLYLLPRFVSSKGDSALTRLGVRLTLMITLAGGMLIFGILLIGGKLVVAILFGSGYGMTVTLLPWLALAWIPWAMAQAILVRITAVASRSGLVVLVVIAIVQWIGASALLPDINAMVALNGALGAACLVALFVIHHHLAKATAQSAEVGGP